MDTLNNLEKKTHQCSNFVWVICVFGITIPLMYSISLLEKTTSLQAIFSLATALTPTISAFISLECYRKASSNNCVDKKKKERRGDFSLYIGGLMSIVFIAVYIGLSGGIKDNIMAYYFVFIPSATAVAFTTKWGLRIVGLTSMVCVGILYGCYYDFGLLAELDSIQCMGFTMYQIFLILFLEWRTNQLSVKIDKES